MEPDLWCYGQVVLNNATQETDNPDLRDRAYVYWRLLSTDPEVCFLACFPWMLERFKIQKGNLWVLWVVIHLGPAVWHKQIPICTLFERKFLSQKRYSIHVPLCASEKSSRIFENCFCRTEPVTCDDSWLLQILVISKNLEENNFWMFLAGCERCCFGWETHNQWWLQ